MIILHPVNPIREIAGEEDGCELHHAEPEDPGGHVAEIVDKDVLHDGETAPGEGLVTVLGAGTFPGPVSVSHRTCQPLTATDTHSLSSLRSSPDSWR